VSTFTLGNHYHRSFQGISDDFILCGVFVVIPQNKAVFIGLQDATISWQIFLNLGATTPWLFPLVALPENE